jgi:hypothetical protein
VLEAALRAARGAVGRARREGLPVDTSWMLAAPEHIVRQRYCCALTGIPFDADYRTSGAGGTHLAPSPDRIEPEKGYVPGNVRWVLWAVNRAKGEMPEPLFLRICRAVVDAEEGRHAPEGEAAAARGKGPTK